MCPASTETIRRVLRGHGSVPGPGGVEVVDRIRYDYDDRPILATGLTYGAA